ncbi:MAG: lipoate--protein ligase [Bacteroidetes bacterium]|jgi:lipoate-protein ligase A|nr:lipoate--protein ligase [Bacteroidota bacterium]
MRYIDTTPTTDPTLNLAMEEHVLRSFPAEEDYVVFYVNEPSIIIGRNQNTLEEINAAYVEANDIHVVRRISGGGAVYHDHGNLNFSFITDYAMNRLNNFQHFTRPVIEALDALGVPAELQGRNDIVVDGRKVSGNAQYSTGSRMFSHGTLLFDSNLGEVQHALEVKQGKIESKGHKSVRSRVANIVEFLDDDSLTVEDLRAHLLASFKAAQDVTVYEPTDADWAAAEELAEAKYRTWAWNYGASPDFDVQRARRFDIGEVDIRLNISDGRIQEIAIFGDFLGHADVAALEEQLQGTPYRLDTLTAALDDTDVPSYFGGLSQQDFLQILYARDEVDV